VRCFWPVAASHTVISPGDRPPTSNTDTIQRPSLLIATMLSQYSESFLIVRSSCPVAASKTLSEPPNCERMHRPSLLIARQWCPLPINFPLPVATSHNLMPSRSGETTQPPSLLIATHLLLVCPSRVRSSFPVSASQTLSVASSIVS